MSDHPRASVVALAVLLLAAIAVGAYSAPRAPRGVVGTTSATDATGTSDDPTEETTVQRTRDQTTKAGDTSTAGDADARADARARLVAACRWAPAFGGVAADEVIGYDLAVLDVVAGTDGGRDTGPADLARLRAAGTLVFGYLSVGTAEDWRHYSPEVDDAWLLGAVDDWPGEQYVDVRQPGWRRIMVDEARTLSELGVDGLYLDNLDAAETHPELADGFVELVTALHEAAPELLLIGQNGLAVADRLPIDAIAHEDVFARWEDGYRRSTTAEVAAVLPGLRRLRDRGLPVFTVEYTEPGSANAARAFDAALAEGFRPAVTVLDLDAPPHLTATGCAPPG